MSKKELEQFIKDKKSTRQMAMELGISQSNLRWRLKKYELKTKRKINIVWGIPATTFREHVLNSISYSEIARKIGATTAGNDLSTIKKRTVKDGIDCSHMRSFGKAEGRNWGSPSLSHDKIFIQDFKGARKTAKRRLIEDGILKEVCSICSQPPTWHGGKLVMVLDHINGVKNDYRISNLRLLCPNCNSQTSTFSGRNRKRTPL